MQCRSSQHCSNREDDYGGLVCAGFGSNRYIGNEAARQRYNISCDFGETKLFQRRRSMKTRLSIFLIVIALIAGMVSCGGGVTMMRVR